MMCALLGLLPHTQAETPQKARKRLVLTTPQGMLIAGQIKRGSVLELWQILLSVAAISVPAIFTVMARDRSLMTIISEAISKADDKIRRESEMLHDRVSRVRDEHVRRDEFNSHVDRTERSISDLRTDLKHGQAEMNKRLDEIIRLVK